MTVQEFKKLLIDNKWIKYSENGFYNHSHGNSLILIDDSLGVPEVKFLFPFLEAKIPLQNIKLEMVCKFSTVLTDKNQISISLTPSYNYQKEEKKLTFFLIDKMNNKTIGG